MNRLIVVLTVISSISFGFSSCCKDVNCKPGYATLSFIDFGLDDIRTFYLRRYKLNTSFNERIDTTVCTLVFPEFRKDSVILKASSSYGIALPSDKFYLTAGFDYELVIPGSRQVFRITDLIENNKQEKICGAAKRVCDSKIVGGKVNGTYYETTLVIRQ